MCCSQAHEKYSIEILYSTIPPRVDLNKNSMLLGTKVSHLTTDTEVRFFHLQSNQI